MRRCKKCGYPEPPPPRVLRNKRELCYECGNYRYPTLMEAYPGVFVFIAFIIGIVVGALT